MLTIVNNSPQFTDDSSGAKISSVYHGRAWALVGPSSFLLAGSAATLSSLKASNPTFRVVRLETFLHELLGSSDLTTDRLANAIPGNQGR
jgi:hypothetical protein